MEVSLSPKDSTLKELLSKFRPVFGNKSHIQVVKLAGELNRKMAEYEEANEQGQKARRLKGEMKTIKNNLLFHLTQKTL